MSVCVCVCARTNVMTVMVHCVECGRTGTRNHFNLISRY